jgi:hypothetical protein
LRLPDEIAELKARIADLESKVLDLKRQLGQKTSHAKRGFEELMKA